MEQVELFDNDRPPATELMKKVAEKAPQRRRKFLEKSTDRLIINGWQKHLKEKPRKNMDPPILT